jgi:transposase
MGLVAPSVPASRAGDRPLTWRAHRQDPRSGQCSRIAFVLTPGNVADVTVASTLLDDIAPPCRLVADKACDADHFRQRLQGLGAEVVIPSNGSRRRPYPLD